MKSTLVDIPVRRKLSEHLGTDLIKGFLVSDAQIIIIIITDTFVFLITVYQAYGSWNLRRNLRVSRTGPNLVRTLFRQGKRFLSGYVNLC